jgi:hypothetical protein
VPAKFVGLPNIKHVAMPEGSDMCFAACVAAVSGECIDDAHEGLMASDVSQANGETAPPNFETAVRIGSKIVGITPIESPMEGVGETAGILERVYQELRLRNPVALLALHTREDDTKFPHWTLLAGLLEDADTITNVAVMDPKQAEMIYEEPVSLVRLVDDSLPLPGAYAYTLNSVNIVG